MTGVVEVMAVAATAASAAAPYVAAASAVAGAGLAYTASQRQRNALKEQAKQTTFQAQQAELAGRTQVAAIDSNVRKVMASQRARYSAAGVELAGTPETVAMETAAEGDRQMTIARTNSVMQAESRRISGRLLLDQAKQINTASQINLGMSLFDTMDRGLARLPGKVTPGQSGGAQPARTAAQADYALGPLY